MRNDNKNIEKSVEEPIEEVIEETVEVEEEIQPRLGVVTECFRLNVREAPSTDAEVVATIDLATEVMVYESESTDDFYKISTATSIEGYCMKQFIAV